MKQHTVCLYGAALLGARCCAAMAADAPPRPLPLKSGRGRTC